MNPIIIACLRQCDKVEFDPVSDEIAFMSTTRNITPYVLECAPKRQMDMGVWKNRVEDFLITNMRTFNIKYLDVYDAASKKITDYCKQNGVKLCIL